MNSHSFVLIRIGNPSFLVRFPVFAGRHTQPALKGPGNILRVQKTTVFGNRLNIEIGVSQI